MLYSLYSDLCILYSIDRGSGGRGLARWRADESQAMISRNNINIALAQCTWVSH